MMRKLVQKGACFALEELVENAVQDMLLGELSNVIYTATTSALDRIPGKSYVGRTINKLSRRLAGHHRQLEKLLGVVVVDKGISIKDAEATLMKHVAGELGEESVETAIEKGAMANLRRAGGGNPLPMCKP